MSTKKYCTLHDYEPPENSGFALCPKCELASSAGSPWYWQSWAEWPDGLVNNTSGEGKNCSVDRHDTREQAQAVCDMLRRNGFGGERCHFPVKTWVMPVFQCCFALQGERLGVPRCENRAVWAGTFNGKDTGLFWCEEHGPAARPFPPTPPHGIRSLIVTENSD